MREKSRLTNPRRRWRPLVCPCYRFEPNPPALTLSTHGDEVIAREAIPAMTDVLVEPTVPRLSSLAALPRARDNSDNFSPQD